jgi:predicted nucleotidyltransferase
MRITEQQRQFIHNLVTDIGAGSATVRLFGSRLDDQAKGGDVDLLVEYSTPVEHPVQVTAMLGAKVSRMMHGRKVDVLISAPNLNDQPIHQVAKKEGALL